MGGEAARSVFPSLLNHLAGFLALLFVASFAFLPAQWGCTTGGLRQLLGPCPPRDMLVCRAGRREDQRGGG